MAGLRQKNATGMEIIRPALITEHEPTELASAEFAKHE
jgi:hypothetical protein